MKLSQSTMKLCLVCHIEFENELEACPKDGSHLVPLGDDPLIGEVLQDRYRVDKVLSRGAMGTIYKGTQEVIERAVAIKVMHEHLTADEVLLKRFERESKALSKLDHPHIITVYDCGLLKDGQPYIVMDLISGSTLSDLLKEKRNLTPDEALPIFCQILDALSQAHKLSIIHRDIKPENIILQKDRNSEFNVKLVDFGIAKVLSPDETVTQLTKLGEITGTPTYMSPEQYSGTDIDERTDIYSTGVMLFECLTGQVPFFSSDLVRLVTMHVAENPPTLSSFRPDLTFPEELDMLVTKALSKDPSGRPQSAAEFKEALINSLKSRYSEDEKDAEETMPPLVLGDTEAVTVSAIHQVLQQDLDVRQEKIQKALDQVTIDQESQAEILQQRKEKRAKTRTLVPTSVRVYAFFQGLLPYALTLVLWYVVVIVVGGEEAINDIFSKKVHPTLVKLGKHIQNKQLTTEQEELLKDGKQRQKIEMIHHKQHSKKKKK